MMTNGFKILLIDDDEDEFVSIRDLLSEATQSKFEMTWSSFYKDGLANLRDGNFDACLLDYRLGEETGIDLLIEANKFGITCPIILLTGQGDFDIDVQAMQIGASDYLVKDQLTPQLLERSLRYAMKHAFDVAELKESKSQILQQDRMASLGLLASSLAHEIGTPMGIIRSRAELAMKRAKDDGALKENMEIVVSQIDKITGLVNSLLHLARGKPTGSATLVNLKEVLSDVLNLLQHELEQKDIRFTSKIDSDFIVKAESGTLGQVLLNLLINSVHAIEEARQNGKNMAHQIHLSTEDRGSALNVIIQDSGCGIAEQNISQLFKPFFTTKEIGHGTGLGLATSYKLVQSWGGSIVVKSEFGKGAIFTITLAKAN